MILDNWLDLSGPRAIREIINEVKPILAFPALKRNKWDHVSLWQKGGHWSEERMGSGLEFGVPRVWAQLCLCVPWWPRQVVLCFWLWEML